MGAEEDEGYKQLAREAKHNISDEQCQHRDIFHAQDPEAWCPPCRGTVDPRAKTISNPTLTSTRDYVTKGENEQGHDLLVWWMDTANTEVTGIIAKALEYGGMGRALDLTDIGRQLVNAGVKVPEFGVKGSQEAWLAELGIYFYLVGKFARWTAAISEGRHVSDDTLLDIGIYVRMAQRIRAVGGWPV